MPDNQDSSQPTDPSPRFHGLDPGELLARGLHTVKPSGGGKSWEPPTPEELVALLPQYHIESLLGHGGMGAVYKGTQAALDRQVAIKLLPAELAADADFIARFQREARTLARLQHSGIVAVYDFGQTSAGNLYFVMEFVDGTDLQRILKQPGLKPEQAFVLIGQICEALHYAHQQGVIHRDIKPANILIAKDGRAKVADFGLARPVREETGGLTGTNVIMGTPDYMAPETRTGAGHPDHRADIFALGVMLYEMLTGQRPHGAFQPPSQRVQVDVRIDEVVLKALQQEPDRRYQQASEMKVDVDHIRTTPPVQSPPPKSLRKPLLIAAAVLISIIVAIISVPILTYFLAKGPAASSVESSAKSSPVATAPSDLPWQTLDRTSPQWDDKALLVDGDGWIEFKTTGETPHQISLTAAAPSNNLGLFRDVALRVHYRWNPQQRTKPGLYLSARNRAESGRAETWLTGGGIALDVSGGDGLNRQRMLPQPLKPGEEGTFELAVIGQRMLVRLNGQVIFDETSAGLNRTGSLKIRVQHCLLRDIQHLNLDGVADPLKALGWEVLEAGAAKDEGWRDFLAELADGPHKNGQLGQVWKKEDGGWRVANYHTFTIPDEKGRDLAIRATGTGYLGVFVRDNGKANYSARLFHDAGLAKIQLQDQVLKQFRLGPDFDATKSHSLELRSVGNTLSLLVDGVELGSVQNDTLPPGARFGVTAGQGGLIEKVEYRFLDAPIKTGLVAPSPEAIADAKKRFVEARAHLKAGDEAGARKLVDAALQAAPEDLGTMAEAALLYAEAQAPERALTLAGQFTDRAPAEQPQFAAIAELRVKLAPKMKEYQARLDAAAALVAKHDDAGEIRELQAALALVPDGAEAAARLEKNPVQLGRPLPGRRFTGALGYTYVPVDGLPNVLFSTWETRLKDFEQFVKETNHDMSQPRNGENKALTWQKPGFEQTGDHPVVMVSREDAEFFCRWLTDLERKAGRLLPGQVYRLPTDREWSAAMGVLNEPGDFPIDRRFPTDVFPWPKDTQPKHNAENLNWKNDDFPFTAPVGSGQPNRFGIYDLLGNVQELCADPWSFTEARSVMRGSSFHDGQGVSRSNPPYSGGFGEYGIPELGFRCVLDLKTEEQRRVQIAMEAAVEKLHAYGLSQKLPRREITILVNDEMVLLNMGKWHYLDFGGLAPFTGLPVTHLIASGGKDNGLAPLQTMNLRALSLASQFPQANYYNPIQGLRLEFLRLVNHPGGSMGGSASLLQGMQLKMLDLDNFKHLGNLEPLRGMPLEGLHLRGSTPALDLKPLKGAPLVHLSVPKDAPRAWLLEANSLFPTLARGLDFSAAQLLVPVKEALAHGNDREAARLLAEDEKAFAGRLWWSGEFGKSLRDAYGKMRAEITVASLVRRAREGDFSEIVRDAKVFNGHAYLLVRGAITLDDGQRLAQALGGHLVTITSKEENDFLKREFMTAKDAPREILLGAKREGTEGGWHGWKWVTGEEFPFTDWSDTAASARPEAGLHVGLHAPGGNGKWWYTTGPRQAIIIEWDTPTPQQPPAAAR